MLDTDGCSNWHLCSTHPILFVHPFSHFHSILIPFSSTMMHFWSRYNYSLSMPFQYLFLCIFKRLSPFVLTMVYRNKVAQVPSQHKSYNSWVWATATPSSSVATIGLVIVATLVVVTLIVSNLVVATLIVVSLCVVTLTVLQLFPHRFCNSHYMTVAATLIKVL